jgi:hypothetical protein
MKNLNSKIIKRIFVKIRHYFLAFAVFLVVIVVATFWLVGKVNQTKIEIDKLKSLSVANLDQIDHQSVVTLSTEATKIASFLPDKPNLYQIISLIDQLASETRFTIQSYGLSHTEAKLDSMQKQSLKLVGVGTIEQFMDFLENYKFVTGKLLSVDSVDLTGDKRVLSNLTVNTYTFEPEVGVNNESIRALDKTDNHILKQIKKYYRGVRKVETDTKYESKDNPFVK